MNMDGKRVSLLSLTVFIAITELVDFTYAGPSRFTDMELLQTLLARYKSYNPRTVRPGSAGDPVVVKVYPTIMRVVDVDERNGILKSRISLSMSWMDSLLSWNPFMYNNITRLHVPPVSHWQPDITVHNTVVEPITTSDAWTLLTYTGSITSVTFLDVQTYCQLDLRGYPRDIHTCNVTLASWMYSAKYLRMEFWDTDKFSLDIKMWEEPGTRSGTSDNPRWELVKRTGSGTIRQVAFSCCPDDPFDQLTITLTLKRRHMSLICLFKWHVLVFLLLVPCQFALPLTAGTRSIFGVLILIGLTVAPPSLSSYLPSGMASVPNIGCVYISGMIYAAISVLGSVAIVAIETKKSGRTNPPKWAMKVCGVLQRLLRLSRLQTSETSSSTAESMVDSDGNIPNGQELNLDEAETDLNKDADQINANARLFCRNNQMQRGSDKTCREWRTVVCVLDRLCLFITLILFIVHAVIVSIV